MVVVKVERDGQRHGSFGRGQQNDKQGDHLPVEPERGGSGATQVGGRKGNEVEVGAVEDQFDSHQHPESIALQRHANHPGGEQNRPYDQIMDDAHRLRQGPSREQTAA